MRKASAGLLAFLLASSALAQSPTPIPQVSITTNIPTYMAADGNIANTGAGDIFCLAGGAIPTAVGGRRVYINEVHANATATSAIIANVSLIKRSSAPSGGTPVAETIVALSTNNPTSIATATGYTVSPTPGTAIGTLAAQKIAIGVQGNTAAVTDAQFFFGDHADQALRITSPDSVCINVSAAGAGASWAVYIRWTEQ